MKWRKFKNKIVKALYSIYTIAKFNKNLGRQASFMLFSSQVNAHSLMLSRVFNKILKQKAFTAF